MSLWILSANLEYDFFACYGAFDLEAYVKT